jgi:ribose 5-phosphate isomerase
MEAAAAKAAVAWAQHHMIVGLGSGSAASLVVSLLGKRVAQGESLGSSVLRRQPNA